MKILELLSRIDNVFAFVIKVAVTVLGLFIAFAMVGGILFRALLGIQVFGLEELVLMAAMWLYMLGAALASRERTHLSADFFQAFSDNEVLHSTMNLVATTLSLLLAVFFVRWSYSIFSWGFEKGQVTPVFGIPQYFSQASLLVASVFLLLYVLRDFVHDVSKLVLKAKAAAH
ncbi:TRAP transporter small permease [Billgrantia antri]|uniref:TRAP transporter small permease protein n=1 Tax=Halomonas sulfidivorans TaxID=2733488 RepID=A0ABX7WBI5_9GAMM|nr:TRAP transporter small permease [Halomonas sulfidivorans]QTP57470.1 TRAP transporter small permease [Halomonas sulfidivorans]